MTSLQMAPFQRRLQADLGTTDSGRIATIVSLLDSQSHQVSVADALPKLFPASRSLDSQNKLLSQSRERFNTLAEEHGLPVRWQITAARSPGALGRFIWFEGDPLLEVSHTTDELTRAADNLIEGRQGLPLHTEPRIALTELRAGKPVVRWFASYAHGDKKALALIHELDKQLGNNRHYHFEAWTDQHLLVGEDWHAGIKSALAESHLGVLLLSHAFLRSDYIKREELPVFVAGQSPAAEGKRVVPVALEAFDLHTTDLKGLQARQIFRDADSKAFAQRTGAKCTAWVDGLVVQMTKLLDRHADRPMPAPAVTALSLPERDASKASSLPRAAMLRARDMLSGDMEGVPHLMTDIRAKVAGLDERQLEAGARPNADEGGVDVLEYLLDWAGDANAPPLFALLGEYGMGKTITCQRLVREIEARREQAPQGSTLPQPLYFDLRRLTGLRSGRVPFLPDIIDECVQRGWAPGSETPSAAELLQRGHHQAWLWVFDGLDEALVHLSEIGGQNFTRELLRLQPMLGHGTHPLTRVLFSCRTHYFRSLRDQNNHFTGQQRQGAAALDYRALLMLPLGEAQILGYLRHALPGIDAEATLELVKSVHNLSELAERPFTLRLVSEFIPQIEQWRAQGKPVYGVTLYRQMVASWLARDNGKHHLRPEHKERLMTHLAAWMWKRGQRLIDAGELEPWFHEWLERQPDLRLRYRDVGIDKLDEDLRTATFLVREDGDDAQPGSRGGFRFAHSSMQEFFLALHLFESLTNNERDAWAMPLVSYQSRRFFAQLLQEADDRRWLEALSVWRAPYLALASEQWLRYALDAAEKAWLAPGLAGAAMNGANLHGWQFVSNDTSVPLNLAGADFSGCELRETTWRDVLLEDANFQGAALDRAEWWRVRADGLHAEGLTAHGACFREVQWAGGAWNGACGEAARFLFTAVPPPWRADARTTAITPRPLPAGARARWLDSAHGHAAAPTACAFSPDGLLALSTSHDNTLRLWHVPSGQCRATWQGHEGSVTACAFSPDGQLALSASHDNTLKLWHVPSGQCRATWLGHKGAVNACAFSPDGQFALSASYDNTLKLWHVPSGQCRATWLGHKDWVNACAFSPDGQLALSASDDDALKLWHVHSAQCLATWQGHGIRVGACAFSPDGQLALSTSWDNTLKLLHVPSGQCRATWLGHKSTVKACAFSPDGRLALSAVHDNTLKLWHVRSGRCRATWQGHESTVTACVFSPDGQFALSASWDKTLKLWHVPSGQCRATWQGHEGPVTACAISPNGQFALSASWDKSLKLWHIPSGQCRATWQGHEDWISACALSPDGQLALSASDDSTVKLWHVPSGQCRATWRGHENWVTACAFSPDGQLALSASWDNTLKLWHVPSGQCRATWQGHTDSVTACAFSPDGQLALSASHDNTLKLWHVRSGQCRANWQGHENWVAACAFSPDAQLAISAGHDGTFRLWNAVTGQLQRTHHLVGGEFAVWSADRSQLLEASAGAWRWLSAQIVAEDGTLLDVWPAESLISLPFHAPIDEPVSAT